VSGGGGELFGEGGTSLATFTGGGVGVGGGGEARTGGAGVLGSFLVSFTGGGVEGEIGVGGVGFGDDSGWGEASCLAKVAMGAS